MPAMNEESCMLANAATHTVGHNTTDTSVNMDNNRATAPEVSQLVQVLVRTELHNLHTQIKY